MLVGIPFNGGALGIRGQEKAPLVVFKKLKEIEFFERKRNKLLDYEPFFLEVNNNNIEDSFKTIEKFFSDQGKNEFFYVVGGDHSITYPLVKGIFKGEGRKGIIVFDAHPDVEPYPSIPAHDSWLRALLKEEIIDEVILLGVRNIGEKEMLFLKENENRVFYYSARQLMFDKEIIDDVMSRINKWSITWLSIDIDVLDPLFAPGTFYKEPFGLDLKYLSYFIERISFLKNLKGMDVVEVNPDLDKNELTSKIGALLMVLMGRD